MTTSRGYKFTYLKSLHGLKFPSDTYYRVLVTLLDYANPDGTSAYPGNGLLAKDCCCSVDTVKRVLSWARARHIIVLVKRGRRNAGASVWRFPESAQGGMAAPMKEVLKGADDTVLPGSQQCTTVHPHHINTSSDGLTSQSSDSDVGGTNGQPTDKSGGAGAPREVVGLKDGFPEKRSIEIHHFDTDDCWTGSPIGSGDEVDVLPGGQMEGNPNNSAEHIEPTHCDAMFGAAPCKQCGETIDLYEHHFYTRLRRDVWDCWHAECNARDAWGGGQFEFVPDQ
ncbi:helix-turn-helix domain-containing protein [Mycobacterium sp. 21AC1]|uniref:helix-turn-helix domain-containing protein n=1 Tax=[Mycobacterium] appelbergii TaxID=2939269 RepID=UPI002938FC7B|nr:helix-turn-helix domain-containing protein [Mycobacterium sp. 21AC1]MDV3129097.1 helix-turn-helix domain-containing protein [Mycobacterium sp. 21AC1]